MATGYSLHIGVASATLSGGESLPAPGCDRVAVAMETIAKARGFSDGHRIVRTNETATFKQVTKDLNGLIGQLKDDDLLFISFAGHGDKRDDGDCEEGRNQMLVLHDHQWIDDEIYAMLAGIPVKARVIVVVNACHSSSILTGITPVSETRHAAATSARRPRRYQRKAVGASNGTAAPPAPLRRLGSIAREMAFGCRPPVKANVLLLAATDETTKGGTKDSLPPFTDVLLKVWQASSSYSDLRDNIAAGLSTLANPPLLNPRLVTDGGFVMQKPFQVQV